MSYQLHDSVLRLQHLTAELQPAAELTQLSFTIQTCGSKLVFASRWVGSIDGAPPHLLRKPALAEVVVDMSTKGIVTAWDLLSTQLQHPSCHDDLFGVIRNRTPHCIYTRCHTETPHTHIQP